MLDEYCLVNTEHIRLTPLLFHYLWFRITDVCYGVKVVITSGWGGSKRINRQNNCNSNTFYETWKEFCGLLHPKPCQQNADVGRCLAWKKRWALEHLSVYSSRNTNLLENKRGKNFFSMVKEFGKYHILYLCTLPWGFIQLEMLKFPQLKKDQKSN